MTALGKIAVAALAAAAAAIGVAPAASAGGGVIVEVGGPGYYYDYYRPCWYYRYWDLPAPGRCYRDFYGFYGPGIFFSEGFVFRDRDDFGRWRDRDDFRHWRDHDGRRDGRHDFMRDRDFGRGVHRHR